MTLRESITILRKLAWIDGDPLYRIELAAHHDVLDGRPYDPARYTSLSDQARYRQAYEEATLKRSIEG